MDAPVCIQASIPSVLIKNSDVCIRVHIHALLVNILGVSIYKQSLPVYMQTCIGRLHAVSVYIQVISACPYVYKHCLFIHGHLSHPIQACSCTYRHQTVPT